jgi:hypothetical protein
MVNLPIKGSSDKVAGEVTEHGTILIYNTNGYRIEELHDNKEALARDIARLITEARDQGFTQALKHIRMELGCKE